MAGRNYIEVGLEANGQRLTVTKAPTIASAVVGYVRFIVATSSVWDGLPAQWLVLKNGATSSACEMVDGVAVAEIDPLAVGGALECALVARNGYEQLTTNRVIIPLQHSGKERR